MPVAAASALALRVMQGRPDRVMDDPIGIEQIDPFFPLPCHGIGDGFLMRFDRKICFSHGGRFLSDFLP
jgi:hypothetical protein